MYFEFKFLGKEANRKNIFLPNSDFFPSQSFMAELKSPRVRLLFQIQLRA